MQVRHFLIFVALLALLLPARSPAQVYSRRRPSTATATAGPYSGPAVTFHGTLKALTKKELIMELDSAGQASDQTAEDTEEKSLTLRISRKTKFLKNDREIKPSDIPVGAHLTLDATRDGDLKLSALNVMVAAPAPAKPEK